MIDSDPRGLETVTVVVPTYRRPDALRRTLDSLLALDFPPERYEVVIVDDLAGDDATAEVVRSRQQGRVRLQLSLGKRRGAAAARNAGARVADGELLLFCDDDMLVEPSHLRLHLEARSAHDDPLVAGVLDFPAELRSALERTPFGRYRLQLAQRFEADADGSWLGQDRYSAAFLSACNLAVRRELFWQIGGFDETFPYAGAEDQDLSLRAREAGCPLIRDHRIRVLNNEQIITFRQFCMREERSAHTAVPLVRKFPDQAARLAIFTENRPIASSDNPRLALKKALKLALSRRPVLATFHRVIEMLERVPPAVSLLPRVYRAAIGLHIFRGVRAGIRRGRDSSGRRAEGGAEVLPEVDETLTPAAEDREGYGESVQGKQE